MDPHLEQHPGHRGTRQRRRRRNYVPIVTIAMAAATAALVGVQLSGRPIITGLFPGLVDGSVTAAGQRLNPHADHVQQAGSQPLRRSESANDGDGPPPGLEEEDAPLGRPPRPAVANDSYAFLAINDDGTPVGYSPCRPLHYVVNADIAPAATDGLVEDAVAKISSATGIQFVLDGDTEEQPGEDRAAYQPRAYGERWAPLLVSWTTPEAAPALSGDVIGTGGSTMYSFGEGPRSYVTGSLELDTPQIRELLHDSGGRDYVSAVIQHELGHVMGLDHVNDPVQLMYPEIGAPDGLASGDLNGLYKLSTAICRKDL